MTTSQPSVEARWEPPLRKVRKAQGMSLREAARRARIDPTQLSRVERGMESLSLESLARLAKVLGLRDLHRHLTQYIEADR